MYVTENIIQELRFQKQFACCGKVTCKSSNGILTWYPDSKALYFKGNNQNYFSEKGQFLGNVIL